MSTAPVELAAPTGAQYGWITGRKLSADLDATDADLLPAFETSTGWVNFSGVALAQSGSDLVTPRTLRFQINGGDLINVRTGSKGPHALPVGLWDVSFDLLNGDREPAILGVPIAPEHTQSKPLALSQMRAIAHGPIDGSRTGGPITVTTLTAATIDAALAARAYWKGYLTSTSPIDDLASGWWGIGSPQVAGDLGMPVSQNGFVRTTTMGPGSFAEQLYVALAASGSTIYRRTRYVGQPWTPWVADNAATNSLGTRVSTLEANIFWRGYLSDTSPIDELPTGMWGLGNPAVATALGMPASLSGLVESGRFGGNGSYAVQVFSAVTTGGTRIYRRSRYLNRPWSAWERSRTGTEYLTATIDLDNLEPDDYRIGDPAVAGALNLPESVAGFLRVERTSTAAAADWRQQTYTPVYKDGTLKQYRRTKYINAPWGAWTLVGQPAATTNPVPPPTGGPARQTRPHSGPGVILRFDDGYQNNLTIAAPVLGAFGYRGTIYMGLSPAFLGSQLNGNQIMTAAEVKRLHNEFGWEIGSHTAAHDRWDHAPDKAAWIASVRRAVDDAIALGLPRVRSFAYPNGKRGLQGDDALVRVFDHIAHVGDGQSVPTPWDRPNLMTGWQAYNTQPAALAHSWDRLTRYILTSLEAGWNPIVGMHGISPGSAPAPMGFFQDEANLRKLCEWLNAIGAPVITQDETRVLNLVRDPAFWDQAPYADGSYSSYPWIVMDAAWTRVARSDGGFQMQLNPTSATSTTLAQTVSVVPGRSYKIHWEAASTITSGTVALELVYRSPLVDVAANGASVLTVVSTTTVHTQTSGERTMSATITVPDDPRIAMADLTIRATGFVGQHTTRWVGMWDAREYDPISAYTI